MILYLSEEQVTAFSSVLNQRLEELTSELAEAMISAVGDLQTEKLREESPQEYEGLVNAKGALYRAWWEYRRKYNF